MTDLTFVSDENGNIADIWWWGDEERARASLATLKNCRDCRNCSRCSGCSRCFRCSRCSGCSRCFRCSRCSRCSDCSDCSRCSDCSDCSRCSDCRRVKSIKEAPSVVGPFRSNSYQFVITKDGGVRAGCRVFDSFDDARKHWKTTRGGTPLGDETMRILDWLEAEHNARSAKGN